MRTLSESLLTSFGAIFLILAFAVQTFDAAAEAQSAENVPLANSKAVIYTQRECPVPAAPIHLKAGPQLFLDERLIESSENVHRVVNVPRRDPAIPNPIVTGKEDGCFQPYLTVLHDADTGRYRLWFGHRTDSADAGGSHIGYMESEDGIHWIRPAKVLPDPGPIQFGSSVVDDPHAPDSPTRYKYAWWKDGGLRIATSPDGLTWTPLSPNVLLPHNHDITGIFWDPLRARCVATISVYRTGDAWSGQRRCTMQSFSSDWEHWETPHYVLTPNDAIDKGETQFYAMDGYLVRGTLTIGMVKVLRDDLKADSPPDPPDAYGMGYSALAWTYDGDTWFRDTEHYFDPDPRKGAWDHAHAWIDEQLSVGNEVYLYYGGYARGHKVNRFEERQIGLLKIKRDRYVAREAGKETGRIVTRPLSIEADHLTINADAHEGRIDVRFLSEDSQPIPGFAATEPVRTDSLDAPVPLSRSLHDLAGKVVRIEFSLKDARLFAFDLK